MSKWQILAQPFFCDPKFIYIFAWQTDIPMQTIQLAKSHTPITIDILKELSALVMKNTGKEYKTALGDFSSAKGELRLLNVTAGIGGKSYMSYNKIPTKLAEFCNNLNEVSFDAHYNLVTIHPWADGNGRMARLLMNLLQFEFGLIPTKILKEDKEEYIKALVATRENEDLNIFRKFMTSLMIRNLTHDIETYRKTLEEDLKSREKIIALLSNDNTLTMAAIAKEIGITQKAVEKQIARLKADGIIKRIGPDKGGHWLVINKQP